MFDVSPITCKSIEGILCSRDLVLLDEKMSVSKFHWGQSVTWAGIGLFGLIILAIGAVVVRQSFAAGVGWLGLPLVCVAIAVIAFATHKSMAPRPKSLEERRAQSAWQIGTALVAAVSVLAGIFSALGPLAPPARPRIIQKMDGVLWGRPGCRIAFRFAVRERALIIDNERPAGGDVRTVQVATITGTGRGGDELYTRGQLPRSRRNTNSTFAYWTDGVAERIDWDDHRDDLQLGLFRCR